ncbi:hypothetical protein AVEN_261414-1 [Araneus ventricosus]|uniref:Uncharacterized protein n=1 Tax=Araneus ventricosus TaxID=182803 RepID=A0A4Y2VTJ8_ARAVE|nr:hypothetical protein AVEN_261414-1 [Araneus ventricosus]
MSSTLIKVCHHHLQKKLAALRVKYGGNSVTIPVLSVCFVKVELSPSSLSIFHFQSNDDASVKKELYCRLKEIKMEDAGSIPASAAYHDTPLSNVFD